MRASFAVLVSAVAVPRTNGAGCGPDPVDAPTDVRIEGLVADGRPVSVACHPSEEVAGSFQPPRATVTPGSLLTVDAPCTLYAYRWDGALIRRSPPVRVQPGADRVTIELDPEPIAGLGITFEPRPDGVRVTGTIALGPAEGRLQRGDLIVAVDGRPTRDLTSWDFRRLGMGPAGTSVVIEVDDPPSGRRTVELVRATIGIDDVCEDRRLDLELDRHARGLRGCFTTPSAYVGGLDLELSLSVDTVGGVSGTRVEWDGPSTTDQMRCVARRVGAWTFTARSEEVRVHRVVKFREP